MDQTGTNMACAAPAEIKIIKDVAISTLFFVLLLLLLCYGVFLVSELIDLCEFLMLNI